MGIAPEIEYLRAMIIAVYLVGSLVFLGTVAYFLLMIYFPEWVGMSGRSAQRTLDNHKEGSEPEVTFLDKQ